MYLFLFPQLVWKWSLNYFKLASLANIVKIKKKKLRNHVVIDHLQKTILMRLLNWLVDCISAMLTARFYTLKFIINIQKRLYLPFIPQKRFLFFARKKRNLTLDHSPYYRLVAPAPKAPASAETTAIITLNTRSQVVFFIAIT